MRRIFTSQTISLPRDRTVALDDRRRLPWRFLARHIAIDALTSVA